jgi:predicted AAA+ superfamily ATPase
MKKRYLAEPILSDLAEKMVFLGGPRQVGKTTLALWLAREHYKGFDYLNWDNRDDRRRILRSEFRGGAELLVFDEVHKYKDWKNHLKGIFDVHKDRFRIIVTGSARLDIFRRGGDSLMGRYHYYRLHPFSLAEYLEMKSGLPPFEEIRIPGEDPDAEKALSSLLTLGGFPEPLLRGRERTLRRWQNERVERLVSEDIRDLQAIREIAMVHLLTGLIPGKVGSLFSINALREDLQVSHKTLSNWMEVLERFYYLFRMYPFTHSRIRSLKKESKVYLWDWSEVPDRAARLENLVAAHLLKLCHFLHDVEGYRADLYYLRDADGREVDFLVTVGEKPWFAVEVKSSYAYLSRNLTYFGSRLAIPQLFQIVGDGGIDLVKGGVRIVSADRFLRALP